MDVRNSTHNYVNVILRFRAPDTLYIYDSTVFYLRCYYVPFKILSNVDFLLLDLYNPPY